MVPHRERVLDWASDFDILDPGYVADPYSIWDELRSRCPIAHTFRRASTWMLTRYEDVVRVADLIDELGGRRHALALADRHLDAAIAALGRVPLAPEPVAELVVLAHYVTERDR
jgi:geranylgeranyl pyrophosphate synthase